MKKVFIGFDTRLSTAYIIAHRSLISTCSDLEDLEVKPLLLSELYASGLYNRETFIDKGQMYDSISEAPMSTEFAISRFLTPYLSGYKGWSIFFDSDFLILSDIHKAFALADSTKAVQVVKHNYNPKDSVKMDNRMQTNYNRKNWSSFILFNNEHPSNKKLDIDLINSVPGRDLHGFCWLEDDEIGELPTSWNFLDGFNTHNDVALDDIDIVHYTHGTPDIKGYEDAVYADLWREYEKEIVICSSASLINK